METEIELRTQLLKQQLKSWKAWLPYANPADREIYTALIAHNTAELTVLEGVSAKPLPAPKPANNRTAAKRSTTPEFMNLKPSGGKGWFPVVGSDKRHYDAGNGRSVCNKVMHFGHDLIDAMHNAPNLCGSCKRTLKKQQSQLFATAASAAH